MAKNYYPWHWKLGSKYPNELGNLCLVWDFPVWSICKKIRYLLFLQQHSGSHNVRGSVHQTSLFPLPESVVSLCLFSVVLPFVLSLVVQWSSVQYVSVCRKVSIWMCVFQGCCFFYWCRINYGAHMCVETVWGLVVSCPPTLDFLLPPRIHLIIFLLPFLTTAFVPLCHHPSFVYSIEDVLLNILRPAESSSNFRSPVYQMKTKACAKYIWMRSLNLSELTFYFYPFL